jgi:hypothetical protein
MALSRLFRKTAEDCVHGNRVCPECDVRPEGEWRKGRRRQLDGGQAVARGRVKLFISHGASSTPEGGEPSEPFPSYEEWRAGYLGGGGSLGKAQEAYVAAQAAHYRAGWFVDWFIVEPRDDPGRQVESLRRAGRTVIELDVEPWNGERDD